MTTLYWLDTTDKNDPFGEASSWTAVQGSSTPASAPPGPTDDAEIDNTAIVSGSGFAGVLNINASGTVSGSLNTDDTNATTLGASAGGSVAIGAGSSWSASRWATTLSEAARSGSHRLAGAASSIPQAIWPGLFLVHGLASSGWFVRTQVAR